MHYLLTYFVAFLLSLGQFLHSEDPAAKSESIKVTLVPENESIQPGHPFWIITRLEVADGWHTYWKNPGEAGMATSIQWELPEGFTAGQIIWPRPNRFSLEGIIGYGYDHEVLLLSEITPPANLSTTTPIDIKANTRWLICSDTSCVPGDAELSVKIAVKDANPSQRLSVKELFTRARALVPQEQTGVLAERKEDYIDLHVPMPADGQLPVSVYFAPESQDVIDHSVDPVVRPSVSSTHYILSLKATDNEDAPNELKGVVVASVGRNVMQPRTHAIDVNVPIRNPYADETLVGMAEKTVLKQGSISPGQAQATSTSEFSGGLLMALLFAFVGGMILNLMPCVLPVVSLKVLSFVKLAGKSRALTIKHGLAFSVGVLISFWALAGALLILQSYGRTVGWGFQLQEPIFVAILASILLVFGLSLFGVFEIGTGITSLAGSISKKREGLSSSFFSGVLATAVATPCTGPFLGSAVGYAVTLPAYQAMLVFTSLGLGMSLPYLLLAMFPGLLRYMPKPGAWMDTFKQLMGFLMLATVLWLVWVFGAQTNNFAITLLLASFFSMSIACWIYGRWGSPVHSKVSRIVSSVIALVFMGIAGYAIALSTAPEMQIMSDSSNSNESDVVAWEPFSAKRIAELQEQGVPVLVDFTAKWCLICQVNHVVLSGDEVDARLFDKGVVKMKADWTKNDPAITEELRKHGRNSVPLYLLYGKDAAQPPQIMPQVLTQDIVLEYLDQIK